MYRKSSVIVMTQAGTEVINDLMISGYWEGLHKTDMDAYLAENEKNHPLMPVFYDQAFEKLRDEKTSLNRIVKEYVKPVRSANK